MLEKCGESVMKVGKVTAAWNEVYDRVRMCEEREEIVVKNRTITAGWEECGSVWSVHSFGGEESVKICFGE